MTILNIYRSGNTYYGSYGRSSDLFATLWSLVQGDALAGDIIQLEGNTVYTALSKLTHKSGINLKSTGKVTGGTIDFTNLQGTGLAFECVGTLLAKHSLQQDALLGSNQIVLSTVSGLAPGSLLLIASSSVWRNNERLQKQGELRYVSHVDGNVVTLTEPLEDSYLVSSCVNTIYQLRPVRDITFDGVRFVNTAVAKNLAGPIFQYGANIHITNCFGSQFEELFLGLYHVRDSHVDNNEICKSWMDGTGYGVGLFFASQNILVDWNTLYQSRHNVSVTGNSQQGGIARHVIFENNTSRDSAIWRSGAFVSYPSQQMDCHHCGEDIQFNYNDISGQGDGFGGVGPYTGLYYKNNIHDIQGIGISTSNELAKKITFQENIIRNAGIYGIILGGQVSYAPYRYGSINIELYKNDINGCPYDGIFAIKTAHVETHGNTIRNAGRYGVNLDYDTQYNITHDNDLTNAGAVLPYLDQGVNNVHYRNLGIVPSDFNTYVVNYRSNPIAIDYIINGKIVPSGTPVLFLPGYTTTIQFQKRVVI